MSATNTQSNVTGAAVDTGVSKLAAKVAHELNNPLDAVLRFVSLAQRKAQSGQYGDIDRYLADAQFGLQRMAEVLRELMELGRQTNEILAGPAAAISLIDLVARATRTAAGQAEQKGVPLIMKSLLPEGFVAAYDLRVAQILANLLKNAIEAAPEGTGVRLTVREAEETSGGGVAIVVEDSGPGIAAEMLPQLFTPFLTTKSKGAGHGLGLAISRELALSLGGNLMLENRLGPQTGCVATLVLPAERSVLARG